MKSLGLSYVGTNDGSARDRMLIVRPFEQQNFYDVALVVVCLVIQNLKAGVSGPGLISKHA